MKRRSTSFLQYLSHEFNPDDDPEVEARMEEQFSEALPLIGLVVMYFNTLEKSLDSAICETLNDRTDSVGLIVLQGMQFGGKVELFRRLCDDLHLTVGRGMPPHYEKLVESLKRAAHVRNLVVHADWENMDAEGFTYVRLLMSPKTGIEQEYVQLTADAMGAGDR